MDVIKAMVMGWDYGHVDPQKNPELFLQVLTKEHAVQFLSFAAIDENVESPSQAAWPTTVGVILWKQRYSQSKSSEILRGRGQIVSACVKCRHPVVRRIESWPALTGAL